MRHSVLVTASVVLASAVVLAQTPGRAPANDPSQDWANLGRYRTQNAELAPPAAGERRVVFMGDSITDSWARQNFFPGKPYVGRGISGQTTPQMLVRFRQDVIALKPAVVVILAGTNDIAGNTGPSTIAMIADNLISMVDIARANGIKVVLASVLPPSDFPWKRGLDPGPKIVELNRWIKDYAAASGVVYLDYHSALVDDKLGMSSSSEGRRASDGGRLRRHGAAGGEGDCGRDECEGELTIVDWIIDDCIAN